ncbi:MAG: sigma-70 family RNA polymerase sigma factor [Bacteroidota bacterium]
MTAAYSDEEIISAIQAGGFIEDRYVKYLYFRFQPKVLSFVQSNSGSEEEARDIYQDGVVSLYENIKTGKYRGEGSLAAYLFSICRFMWLNKLKRKGIEKRVGEEIRPDDFVESALPSMLEQEKEEQILELFGELGEHCREVLIYSIFYGYSMEEIYKKMGYENAQIARNKKYKCIKRLKKLLENREDIRQLLRGN